MTDLVLRRLTAISDELSRARTELDILREQLAHYEGVLDERRIEMLVAETPLAAREHRIAAADRERIARIVGELESTVRALLDERDGLLDRLAGSGEGQTPGPAVP
ncbi:MAG: hypothetical protein HY658_08785 [Actinobacteria bacterium]|nr:hypothetical protein [Actinomycetota bacterium]